ncbi:MAG: hypothetical protein ACR2HR_03695 [Euzebya sp.]
MRNRGFKLLLFVLAGVGGVLAWQRRNETPPTRPRLRPAEPFMDPAAPEKGGAKWLTGTAGEVAPQEAIPQEITPREATPQAVTAELPAVRPADGPLLVDGGPAVDALVTTGDAPLPLPNPPHGPFTTAPDGPADDLKRISGVGPKLEQMLNEQGITTFAQVASLTEAEVDLLQQRLPQFPGRIRRDNWVQQAAKFNDT